MRHIRFLSRLLNRPQMIEPSAGAAVLGALLPDVELVGWRGDPDRDGPSPRDYGRAGAMAVIPITGKLVHRGASMDAMSGLTSYQALGDMVSDALADRSIGGILLDIDSPGGEAAGCLDFAEWLAAQRGEKPIWASVNQAACSAAYAIASGADRILIGEDAHAGSIGVVAYHTDLSAALSRQGIKVTYLHAGAHKLDGVPSMPLSDEARAAWQADIDAVYDRFCAVVARNRGLSVDAVRGTEAAIFRGRDAISAGLADDIATHEEAVMAFAQHTAPSGAHMASAAARGARMAAEKPPAEEPKPAPEPPPAQPEVPETQRQPADPERGPITEPGGAPADRPVDQPIPNPPASPGNLPAEAVAVMAACNAAGFPSLALGLVQARASMAAVRARLADAKAITEAAASMGMASMASVLVERGLDLEGARAVMFAARAAGEERTPTNPTNSGKPAAQQSKADPSAVYAAMNSRNILAKGH